MKQIYIYIIVALLSGCIGWLLRGDKVRRVVEYQTGTYNVPNSLISMQEFTVNIPSVPDVYFLERTVTYTDTVFVLDTLYIVDDFLKLREYTIPMWSNARGEITARATVQYNRLQEFSYTQRVAPVRNIHYICGASFSGDGLGAAVGLRYKRVLLLNQMYKSNITGTVAVEF